MDYKQSLVRTLLSSGFGLYAAFDLDIILPHIWTSRSLWFGLYAAFGLDFTLPPVLVLLLLPVSGFPVFLSQFFFSAL